MKIYHFKSSNNNKNHIYYYIRTYIVLANSYEKALDIVAESYSKLLYNICISDKNLALEIAKKQWSFASCEEQELDCEVLVYDEYTDSF